MSAARPAFDAEFVQAIEAGGHALIGLGDNAQGLLLLVKALEWHELGQPVFACDIDESGGMAEVVELRGYSRKVPPMGCGA